MNMMNKKSIMKSILSFTSYQPYVSDMNEVFLMMEHDERN